LDGYEKEAQVAVRNKICDTIADVARECEEQNRMSSPWCAVDGFLEPWHELLGALFESTKSPEPAHRESAFRVFAALPTLVDKQHSDALKTVFLGGLQDQNPKVSL
jgi:importin-5